MIESTEMSAGEAILRSLKMNGVDYLFTNPGSDFAPIIEAYAGVEAQYIPEPVVVPFENLAVTMAHGYYLATGDMAAAAVHVNVGLANSTMGMINAHSDNVPVFLMSGRNPLTEGDRMGSRHTPIQYGQEMFDQTAMVRETVKWDYELRYPEQAVHLVNRGCAIANTQPHGSVYLSLPREPLCEQTAEPVRVTQVPAAPSAPNLGEIEKVAKLSAEAKNTLIICSRGDKDGKLSRLIQTIAKENTIAVSEVFVTRNVLPTHFDHGVGGNIAAHLPNADVVLVVDTPVAWIEHKATPAPDARVIHLGADPLFNRIPVRGYLTTDAIISDPVEALEALQAALPGSVNEQRRAEIVNKHRAFRQRINSKVEAGCVGVANKPWIGKCISKILGDGVVFSERGGPLGLFELEGPNQWFGNTQAGGLGWGLPAALGYQLANREKLVVCMIGDGSYMFANPVASHQVANAYELPVLTVVLNNGSYDAVRISTLDVYPDGQASAAPHVPMVPFAPAPRYGDIAAAAGCYAETIQRAEDLPAALDRALKVIREEKRPVLLDVSIGQDDGEK